ncbi:MAG: MMPL family transporter, partial [Acidianus infernus]|nr:MMPL family transporter [Acidianus infernus]
MFEIWYIHITLAIISVIVSILILAEFYKLKKEFNKSKVFSVLLVSSVLIWLIVIKLLGITVDFLTPSQVLLLALGLGTDYVVFISSRYIEERRKGLTK